MRELTALNAADYLRDSGRVSDRDEVHVRELTGGVSNIVLRVDVCGQPPFVIKQCRERLRVAMEWHARLDRIWTEQPRSRCCVRSCPREPSPGSYSRTGRITSSR